MELLNQILIFILVIGILVTVHEFGHFIAARMTGMHADVFAIGMGKRLFGYNKTHGFTFGSLDNWEGNGLTDYRVAMLPIGGYVKIAGMVDESMDTEYINTEPQPWEFRSKNAWQKAFVISAGVIMNLLLAVIVYTFLAYSNGKTVYKTTTIAYIEKNSPAEQVGLHSGDKVIKVDNTVINSWDDFIKSLLTDKVGENKAITVSRNGQNIIVNTSGKRILDAMSNQENLGIYPDGFAVLISSVVEGKPAQKLGLQPGDTLVSADNQTILAAGQLQEIVRNHKGLPMQLAWKHGSSPMSGIVTPDASGLIGIQMTPAYHGPKQMEQYNIFESIGMGIAETKTAASLFVNMIGQIFKGHLPFRQAVGGPIMIAKIGAQTASLGFEVFIKFMAQLSVTLAIINILPFPALDGGHLVFILIEGIMRREVPVKVKLAFQQAGIFILLAFMVFVLYNDITR